MISARGATPCNLMLNEVGRAHVAGAVPIVYQPAEVFQVWSAVSTYLRGALLAGINVQLFRRTLSFSCSKRRVFKKIPKTFHRDSQVFDLRVPLFGVAQQFAVTYSLDSPIIEEQSLTYTQMPLKVIAEAAKVPLQVVTSVLHDIMRFVGEALFQGRLLELEFPGVALVRFKRDRVMASFNDDFTAELLAIDTRKWPSIYAQEARQLLVRRNPPSQQQRQQQQQQQQGRPSSARPVSATKAAAAAAGGGEGEQQQRPGSARSHNRAPFCNAPAPVGRTFDEMCEIRSNTEARKKRASSSSSARPSSAQNRAPQALLSGDENDYQQQQQQGSGRGPKSPLAVVYDESVPADRLGRQEENVYDMVMPHHVGAGRHVVGGGGLDNSQTIPPQALSQMPPAPMPRPEQQQQYNQNNNNQHFQPPVATASQQPVRVPRHLQTNSHANIFGYTGLEDKEKPSTSRKRFYGSEPYPQEPQTKYRAPAASSASAAAAAQPQQEAEQQQQQQQQENRKPQQQQQQQQHEEAVSEQQQQEN